MIHSLKISKNYFENVISGKKTFLIIEGPQRIQDGDLIGLNEIDQIGGEDTGRSCLVYVDYVSFDGGGNDDVIISIKPCYVHMAKTPYNAISMTNDYSVPIITI